MFEHLCAPVFVDHAQILEVQLLDDKDSQLVISEFKQLLDDILCFVLLQLLVCNCSGKVW